MFEEAQVIAALNRIASALEKTNAMQQAWIERQIHWHDEWTERERVFRYPPKLVTNEEYPQNEK